MDIKCIKCGEPWDMDELHEQIKTNYPDEPWRIDGRFEQSDYDRFYDEARLAFTKDGCAYFGAGHGAGFVTPEQQELAALSYDFAGEDLDSLAAMQEDMDV